MITHLRVNGWCATCGGTGDLNVQHKDQPRPFVFGKDMLKALHVAGLLPAYPNVSRVVIDIRPNELVMFYVEEIPNEALLNIVPLMMQEASDGPVD